MRGAVPKKGQAQFQKQNTPSTAQTTSPRPSFSIPCPQPACPYVTSTTSHGAFPPPLTGCKPGTANSPPNEYPRKEAEASYYRHRAEILTASRRKIAGHANFPMQLPGFWPRVEILWHYEIPSFLFLRVCTTFFLIVSDTLVENAFLDFGRSCLYICLFEGECCVGFYAMLLPGWIDSYRLCVGAVYRRKLLLVLCAE